MLGLFMSVLHIHFDICYILGRIFVTSFVWNDKIQRPINKSIVRSASSISFSSGTNTWVGSANIPREQKVFIGYLLTTGCSIWWCISGVSITTNRKWLSLASGYTWKTERFSWKKEGMSLIFNRPRLDR